MPQRTTVFVSYCHVNNRWLERLQVHLAPYVRRGDLDLWDDTKLDPGDKWHSEISNAIDRAAASILLISADFLASNFVATHELPKLLRKAELSGARTVPIVVEPCKLGTHPQLASFQSLNSPSTPLAKMRRPEAEAVLARAGEIIGDILGSVVQPPPTGPSHTQHTDSESATGSLFEELHAASIALSILWRLSRKEAQHSLSELEALLGIRSRKRAFEVLKKLTREGWVEKVQVSKLAKYHLTKEGARQLQRLAAAADGPVRRTIAPG
jgi:TIR domain